MKKIFIAPEINVYRIESADIIATSPGLDSGSTGTMYTKSSIIEMFEDDSDADYINIGLDIYKIEE